MRSDLKLRSDLDRISRTVSGVEGIILCVLFGSRARGEGEAHSDYDLLIVFVDKEEMKKNLTKLYEATSGTGLFIQAMPVALEEIDKLEPHFAKTIFEEGMVLYQRYPFTTYGSTIASKQMSIIEYKLDKLSQQSKLKLDYRLFGRKGKGLIQTIGGLRIGRGVVIVPRGSKEIVSRILRDLGARYKIYDILMPPA